MARLFFLIAVLNFITFVVSDCNTNLCVTGCGSFDTRFSSCNIHNQIYGGYETCICVGSNTVADNENNLLNCLSCSQTDIGSNTLQTYENWAVVCGVYQKQGEAAAVSINSGSPDARTSYYTASILPVIESICPQAVGAAGQSASTTSPPSSSTSNSASRSSASVTTTSHASSLMTSPASSSATFEGPASTAPSTSQSQTQSSTAANAAMTPRAASIPIGLVALALGLRLV